MKQHNEEKVKVWKQFVEQAVKQEMKRPDISYDTIREFKESMKIILVDLGADEFASSSLSSYAEVLLLDWYNHQLDLELTDPDE